MPPVTSRVEAKVEQETKVRFKAMAMARGLSESELLRSVIYLVVDHDNGADAPVEPNPKKNDLARMTIRLPGFLVEAVKSRAKTVGMVPSRWVAALVQSNLMREPVTTDAELNALRASSRELAAIGRNINQIARALHLAHSETERVKLARLDRLREAIDRNQATIDALARAREQGWGVGEDD